MKVYDSLHRQGPSHPIDPLDDPVEFIRQEHDLQFQVCNQIEEIYSSIGLEPVRDWARSLRDYLSEDLPRHIRDEEEGLFPILLRRCQGQEEIEVILDQLASEHESDLGLLDPILRELDLVAESEAPHHPAEFLSSARAFVETQRRHLIWENRVVLPLAEKRLTQNDKQALGRNLAARRKKTSAG